ncbi:MAG: ATP:cob(I)alamin adenosyltransferase [Archaeoglobaceae archaeon]
MRDPAFTTSGDGKKIAKCSATAVAIGTIDELNAFVGLAKVHAKSEEIRNALAKIQRMLFNVGAEVAGASRLSRELYDELLGMIEELEAKTKKPKSFLILESDASTAFLSVARAVARRAEREVIKLHFEGKVSDLVVDWLNKLSYFLYLAILVEGENFEEVRE